MNVLIMKLGATGDVVRTTTLLHKFPNNVTWITEAKNTVSDFCILLWKLLVLCPYLPKNKLL
jgi:hypothetical protein